MINFIGKTLVVINAAFSIVALTFAVAIYTNRVDWGWKEPRQELGGRVASEIDKRTAAIKVFAAHRDSVERAIEAAQKKVRLAEQLRPENHLYYVQTLNDLAVKPDKLEVKHIKQDPKTGQLALDGTGRPELEGDAVFVDAAGNKTPVNKSQKAYLQEERDLQKQVEDLSNEVYARSKKLHEKSELISGAYDAMEKEKKIKPGIYDLLEEEIAMQGRVRKELDAIRPIWVRKLVESQILISRRQALQERLEELKKVKLEAAP